MGNVHCPKCGEDISDAYEPADFSVGILSSGYYCCGCDLPVDDVEPDYFDDAVIVGPSPRGEPIGTPLSELSGQPGKPGYAAFARIARSWGFE